MILYEYVRGSLTRYFRPTFRIRTHINPILKSARTIRIIRKPTITKILPSSKKMIPTKPTVKFPIRKIKVI